MTRNDQEIKIIQKIVYRLKCFDRYPLFVKQELARVIYYDKFEDGRLIIKQGKVVQFNCELKYFNFFEKLRMNIKVINLTDCGAGFFRFFFYLVTCPTSYERAQNTRLHR